MSHNQGTVGRLNIAPSHSPPPPFVSLPVPCRSTPAPLLPSAPLPDSSGPSQSADDFAHHSVSASVHAMPSSPNQMEHMTDRTHMRRSATSSARRQRSLISLQDRVGRWAWRPRQQSTQMRSLVACTSQHRTQPRVRTAGGTSASLKLRVRLLSCTTASAREARRHLVSLVAPEASTSPPTRNSRPHWQRTVAAWRASLPDTRLLGAKTQRATSWGSTSRLSAIAATRVQTVRRRGASRVCGELPRSSHAQTTLP